MGYDHLREVLTKKRTLEILSLISDEQEVNYTSIEDSVPSSSSVVTDRLKLLIEYGCIDRVENSPKDVQYCVTTRGETFLSRCEELDQFLASNKTEL